MSDIGQTAVIDPREIGRMASSRTDGRRTTLYGRHRKVRPRRARRPAPPILAPVLITLLAVLWLAAMAAAVWLMPESVPVPGVRGAASAVCAVAAAASAVPSWVYFARWDA